MPLLKYETHKSLPSHCADGHFIYHGCVFVTPCLQTDYKDTLFIIVLQYMSVCLCPKFCYILEDFFVLGRLFLVEDFSAYLHACVQSFAAFNRTFYMLK